MGNASEFATDVFRTICEHLTDRTADLGRLMATGAPFDGWLEAEAYLVCRAVEGKFAEVELRPTYGSEGLTDKDGQPSAERGGLRVGGIGEPGHHLWLFAEFVLLGGDRRPDDAAARLLRLGWKRSASLLIVVGRGDAGIGRRPLTAAVGIALPDGKSVAVQAFDVKPDPADVLVAPNRQA